MVVVRYAKRAERQAERDDLAELIADFDKANGPADPEAVAAKQAMLTGAAHPGGVGGVSG